MFSLLLGGAPAIARAAPAISWMSEPAKPGDVVLVYGGDLSKLTEVAVCRLDDAGAGATLPPPKAACSQALRSPALQATESSLKFVLPAALAPGVFRLDFGGTARLFGLPRVDWTQLTRLVPDVGGDEAYAGATLQIIGRNLGPGPDEPAAGRQPVRVALRGPDGKVTAASVAKVDRYSLTVTLPAALPAGAYTLWVHNGFGGPAAWGGGRPLKVKVPVRWPEHVFDLRQLGARGDNVTDDSAVFRRALELVAAHGGGVVFIPAGTYRLDGTFRLPPKTTLRGAGKDLTWLKWPQSSPRTFGDFLPAALTGRGEYAIEQLSLMVRNAKRLISDDTFDEVAIQRPVDPGRDDADHGRDVFLRHVGFHYLPYAARPSAAPERDPQWPFARWGLTPDAGGELSVAIGGVRNFEASDCDFIGTQRFLDLRNARITGSRFSNPMNMAWTDIGGQHLVLERNAIHGASSLRTATLPLRHVYAADNYTQNLGRGEREALTMDLGRPPAMRRKVGGHADAWSGGVAAASGRSITFAKAKLAPRAFRGFDALIVSGRGAGQVRAVEDNDARSLKVKRAWDVLPDATSVVLVQRLLGQMVFYRNTGEDVSVLLQIWGSIYDCTFDRNVTRRSQGMWGLGGWLIQWLGNRLESAVTFHAGIGPIGPTPERNAEYGYMGFTISGHWTELGRYPYVLGAVMRDNRLAYGHRALVMWGYGGPRERLGRVAARDIVIDHNHFAHTPVGIELDANVAGAVLGANTFEQVEEPLRLLAPQAVLQLPAAPAARAAAPATPPPAAPPVPGPAPSVH